MLTGDPTTSPGHPKITADEGGNRMKQRVWNPSSKCHLLTALPGRVLNSLSFSFCNYKMASVAIIQVFVLRIK